MDCSPPGSSVHGIFQARVLEWVTLKLVRGRVKLELESCSPMVLTSALERELKRLQSKDAKSQGTEESHFLSFILTGSEKVKAIGRSQKRGMEGLGWKRYQSEFLQNPLHFHTLSTELGYVPSAYGPLKHQKSCLSFGKPEGKQLDPASANPLINTTTHPPVHWQRITGLWGFREVPFQNHSHRVGQTWEV